MLKFKTMDDLVLEYKGSSDLGEVLDMSISQIQRRLVEQDKSVKVTASLLQNYLDVEEQGKNRTSLKRWLQYGIKHNKLPGEFFLDFMGEVGIWKSAMQKYIRRSEVDKAVRAASKLMTMQPKSLVRRLKVILAEDCYTSIDLYGMTETDPIAVAGYAAERSKDGHCCRAFNEIKDTYLYKKGCDLDWLKKNYKHENLKKVVSMIFALEEEQRLDEFYDIIRKDLDALPTDTGKIIMNELLTPSKVDFKLTLVAILRMIREGYYPCASKIDVKKFDKIAENPMEIEEADWYAFDMHTFPGRVAKDLVAKSRKIDKVQFGWMWWFGEASIRIPEDKPLDDFKPYYMVKREVDGIKRWKDVREDVIAKVKYVVKELFKIETKL